jgi:hypothetical protein
MAKWCLGGSIPEDRPDSDGKQAIVPEGYWIYGQDPYEPVGHGEGRVSACTRRVPWVSVKSPQCGSCYLFRDPSIGRNGLVADGDDAYRPKVLSEYERVEYDRAMDAALDDDFGPYNDWLDKMLGVAADAEGLETRRRGGDDSPAVKEYRNAAFRKFYATRDRAWKDRRNERIRAQRAARTRV